jgi:hypothetical protein
VSAKLDETIRFLRQSLDQVLLELPYTGRDPKTYRRCCARRDKIAARLKAAETKAAVAVKVTS